MAYSISTHWGRWLFHFSQWVFSKLGELCKEGLCFLDLCIAAAGSWLQILCSALWPAQER